MPTLAADGDTVIYQVEGLTRVQCEGDFGSGTITWQTLGDDGSYHAVANGAFTADADKVFSFPDDVKVRIKGVLSGSTSPDLYYQVSAREITAVG